MAVRRIVANLKAENVADAEPFYGDLLGLDEAMNLGWITTYASEHAAQVQISVASQGGSGTDVPDISIEVDDIDDIYGRAQSAGFEIVYELTDEPWGVRRFYVRDPLGRVVNILSHQNENNPQVAESD